MSRTPRNLILLLAVVFGLSSSVFATPIPIGSITITGGEQSSGGVWDSGTVTATLNGVFISIPYGQYSSPAAIASGLAATISQNCNMPVYAHAVGAVITFYKKGSNVLSSATITPASSNPSLFSSSSFGINGGSGGWSPPQITDLSMPEGPPSMGLIIKGKNFALLSGSVTIGGIPATVVPGSMTSTSITVQVPPGLTPGNADVKVSNGFTSNAWTFKVDAAFGCN